MTHHVHLRDKIIDALDQARYAVPFVVQTRAGHAKRMRRAFLLGLEAAAHQDGLPPTPRRSHLRLAEPAS